MAENLQLKQVLRTMFIGLGGTGNEVIRRVKREMLRHGYNQSIFQYLVLDTMPFSESPMMDENLHLRNGEEYLYIGGYNPNQIIKRLDEWPSIAHWWGARDQTNLVTVDEGAGQMRAVGRMAFFRHFKEIRARFEQMCREVMSGDNREQALRAGYEVSLNRDPIIYLVFSLCGGTGSSLFFDVAYVLRQLLAPSIKPTVVGVAMLPGPYVQKISSLPQQERIQANAYAALQELERLHNIALGQEPKVQGGNIWQVEYATNFEVALPELPFDYLYLVDDTTERGERYTREQLYDLMSQAIYWSSGPTTAGRYWERAKNLISNTAAAGGTPDQAGRKRFSKYSSFGISTVALDWKSETNQDKRLLESFLLKKICDEKGSLSHLPELLNATTLVDKTCKGFAPTELKPAGTVRDRLGVSDLLARFEPQYDTRLAELRRPKWQARKNEYARNFKSEIDLALKEVLCRQGPVAAAQVARLLQDAVAREITDLGNFVQRSRETQRRATDNYDDVRQALKPPNPLWSVVLTVSRGIMKLYGRSEQVQRRLTELAQSGSHELYQMKNAEFETQAGQEIEATIVQPMIQYLDDLSSALSETQGLLKPWLAEKQKKIQEEDAQRKARDEGQFEPVIQVPLPSSNQGQVTKAIADGTLQPDLFLSRMLAQTFDAWPDVGNTAPELLKETIVEKTQVAIESASDLALQQFTHNKHVLARLVTTDEKAQKKRQVFLHRASCLWSYEQDATQDVAQQIESVTLLGVGEDVDDQSDMLLREQLKTLLKDQDPKIEPVATDTSDEMALLVTKHGLPINLLRGISDLQRAYQVMTTVREAPYLHLDYRDQVLAGYAPLTSTGSTPEEIISGLMTVVHDIERLNQPLAQVIREATQQYESGLQAQGFLLNQQVAVNAVGDPLFDLIDTLKEATRNALKSIAVRAALYKLSELEGVLHNQGWVQINPLPGGQINYGTSKVVEEQRKQGILADRVLEVIRCGYQRHQYSYPPLVRSAWVVGSTITSVDRTPNQIITDLRERANDIEHSNRWLADQLRGVVREYEHTLRNQMIPLDQPVEVKDESSPFFDLIDALGDLTPSLPGTPPLRVLQMKLKSFTDIVQAKGWEKIDPARGVPFDQTLHISVGPKQEPSLPYGCIVEVYHVGWQRHRSGQTQTRVAQVFINV
jgi:hypothetical protein